MSATRKPASLTAALEDYLEAIYHLSRFDKAAHSRDIAESLGVHKSTVTAALKTLGQMGMINYSPYEVVTLTVEGEKLAADVVERHKALKDFFTDVLMVDDDTAEKAACGMEHAIPPVIVDKLVEFVAFIKTRPCKDGNWLERYTQGNRDDCTVLSSRRRSEGGAAAEGDRGRRTGRNEDVTMVETVTLDAVAPGRKAEVLSLKGDGAVKKRIAEMGITRGSILEVERVAPLGDPLDIKVKGYRLSLRKEEAARVVVKTI